MSPAGLRYDCASRLDKHSNIQIRHEEFVHLFDATDLILNTEFKHYRHQLVRQRGTEVVIGS